MAILKVSRSHQFRQYDSYLLAGEILKLFIFELLDESSFIFMKNEIIEDKSVNGVMNFSEESLNFLLGDGEVLIDHFFEVSSFLHVGVGVQGNNVPDFL